MRGSFAKGGPGRALCAALLLKAVLGAGVVGCRRSWALAARGSFAKGGPGRALCAALARGSFASGGPGRSWVFAVRGSFAKGGPGRSLRAALLLKVVLGAHCARLFC